MKWYLGCDPGWTNMAYAWLSDQGDLVTGVVVPKDLPKCRIAPMIADEALEKHIVDFGADHEVVGAMMERFVYYKGVHNPNSEQILMVTGQMQCWLAYEHEVTPTMIKAYDWKNRLSKHLFKKGFRNPSDRLDKEFSVAAAEFIFPDYDFKTDHEADAACMAYIASLLAR